MKRIYLDHSATTPTRPEVREAMLPWLDAHFGNAGSLHREGRAARAAVDDARAAVARFLGAEAREIVFTSGATEANATAIASAPGRLALSAVEHPSVREAAKAWKRRGVEVCGIPVDSWGRVCAAFGDDFPALVSVMYANNETGVVQPVAELAAACRARGALYHCDAVQAAGKRRLDVCALGVDFLSLSAHKLGGPQGIGALYVRHGIEVAPLMPGKQERNRRGGTEPVAGIVGFGVACALAADEIDAEALRLEGLRALLEEGLLAAVPGLRINGAGVERVPHIVNAGFEGVDNDALLLALDEAGIAVSTGTTCTAGISAISPVLLAMGQSRTQARETIRFSLGWNTGEEEIRRALEIVPDVVTRVRAAHPTGQGR